MHAQNPHLVMQACLGSARRAWPAQACPVLPCAALPSARLPGCWASCMVNRSQDPPAPFPPNLTQGAKLNNRVPRNPNEQRIPAKASLASSHAPCMQAPKGTVLYDRGSRCQHLVIHPCPIRDPSSQVTWLDLLAPGIPPPKKIKIKEKKIIARTDPLQWWPCLSLKASSTSSMNTKPLLEKWRPRFRMEEPHLSTCQEVKAFFPLPFSTLGNHQRT